MMHVTGIQAESLDIDEQMCLLEEKTWVMETYFLGLPDGQKISLQSQTALNRSTCFRCHVNLDLHPLRPLKTARNDFCNENGNETCKFTSGSRQNHVWILRCSCNLGHPSTMALEGTS